MISETLVRSFLTLARTKNVTEAARQLYLSQQAVSKHLARLEEDLDCILFRRERGGMVLTDEGEIYYEAFSHMEDTLTAARECGHAAHLAVGGVKRGEVVTDAGRGQRIKGRVDGGCHLVVRNSARALYAGCHRRLIGKGNVRKRVGSRHCYSCGSGALQESASRHSGLKSHDVHLSSLF